MRILHTSDWHVGRRTGGHDRSEEHRSVIDEIVALADQNRAEVAIVAGDTFDTSAPSPVSETIVWQGLLDLAEVCPVVVIAGNHDNAARLAAVAPLLERSGITTVASPMRPDAGGVVRFEGLGLKLAALPFISQRGIVRARQIMEDDPDDHASAYADRLRVLIERLTDGMDTETVNVFTGHLTVYEGKTGGERRVHTVLDYAIPASAFPGHLSYVALGHLHRQQKIPHGSAVWYSGSPLQLDFGEAGDQKGVLLVEAEPGLPARVTTIPLTSGRRLVTVSGSFDEVVARAEDLVDSFVKVELDEPARVGLADAVREAIPTAVDVQLKRRARVPSSDHAQRTELPGLEAFAKYLAEIDATDPRVESLFSELLEEVTT